MADNVAALIRLMLVTDDRLVEGRDLVALALAAERGGATSVQLRLKRASPREQVEGARALVASLRIPVLVNDRPDIAVAAGAAGVHLGPDDLPVALARRVVPPRFILGVSVGSMVEGEAAGAADYWGIGPWRATETKPDAGEALGPEGFRRLAGLAGRTPCIAVGGVRPEDLPLVVAAGGAGVAVISGILGEGDVERATRRYAERWPSF
jgi:thiamine-phosphate pyrophosphorylase